MTAIDIDFEVFKALTVRRSSEETTYNHVLRELLGLPPVGSPAPNTQSPSWVWKGVTLSDGTELQATYKGRLYTAAIKSGRWVQDGKTHTSPSSAALEITQSGINGWNFWSVKRPGDGSWRQLGTLRSDGGN